jgi:membrane dipeptidase
VDDIRPDGVQFAVMKRRLPLLAVVSLFVFAVAAPLALTASDDARAIHERLITFDTHLDTPASLRRPGWNIMDRHSVADDSTQVDYPRMVEGGLDGGFWAIYTAQGPRTPEGHAAARDHALQIVVRIREMVAANPNYFALATRADDAAVIAAAGRRIVYLSIENAYPLGHDVSLVKTFYDLGVRMLSTVHFSNNDLADSATDANGREWNGLSPLGREVVAECNRLGLILDASHGSDDVFDQLIALSKTPIILSHSGCKAVCNHPRNLDDERMRKLAASGGLIQMNSLSGYLIDTPPNPERNQAMQALTAKYSGRAAMTATQTAEMRKERRAIEEKFPVKRATFEDFMKHVLHALKVVGPDHVGFGADWDGGGGVIGMEDVADYPKITARLLAEGYTEADCAKIWSGNTLRLLRAAEDYAKRRVGP